MKTLKKRPNYTPSIKPLVKSVFSLYSFFRKTELQLQRPPELWSFFFCFSAALHLPALLASRRSFPDRYIGEGRTPASDKSDLSLKLVMKRKSEKLSAQPFFLYIWRTEFLLLYIGRTKLFLFSFLYIVEEVISKISFFLFSIYVGRKGKWKLDNFVFFFLTCSAAKKIRRS